jgi:enediyne biosynthesis protein E4
MQESPIARVALILFFIGLLATPLVIKRFSVADEPARPVAASDAIHRYGFALEEAAAQSGVHFTHEAPVLDHRLDPIMPEIASMGAGVSIVDFDKDGNEDFYVTNSGEGSKNQLYHNLGNGKFEEVAEKMGVADLNRAGEGACMGAVWGDYDNDGYEDLLVYKWGRPELFHNDAGKGFTRVTEAAGLPKWVNANSAIWLDYDNDGKLDLLICGYYRDDIDLWHLKTTRIMPESFEYANNGGRKYLLRNVGGGKFEDVTAKVGLDSHRWTLAAVAADLHGTGYPDIVLANDYGITELYENVHGTKFREIGKETGIGEAPKSGMNASVGDILNQGKYSLYVSNISEEGNLIQGNNLWVPKEGAGGKLAYDNLAHDMGVELGGWSFGAQFADLNNDGYQDIYLVNGYISADRNRSYWYDFGKIAGGHGNIIDDANNWPAMRGQSLSGYQQKHIWLNDGVGHFTEVAQLVGARDIYDGRAVALADFRNNGALDVVVANENGPLLLYKNDVDPKNRWIEFDLEGTKSNRSAIGAEVRLFWNGQQQVQEVSGGSGFCAQNQRRLHFGLGKSPKVEKAVIRWPSGVVQTLTAPEIGVIHKVKES